MRTSRSAPEGGGWGRFSSSHFLAGKCPNRGRDSISCCWKTGEEFSRNVETCRRNSAIGCTIRGPCINTLLRRLFKSKCFLEGLLEGACMGFSKDQVLRSVLRREPFIEGAYKAETHSFADCYLLHRTLENCQKNHPKRAACCWMTTLMRSENTTVELD